MVLVQLFWEGPLLFPHGNAPMSKPGQQMIVYQVWCGRTRLKPTDLDLNSNSPTPLYWLKWILVSILSSFDMVYVRSKD